MARDDQHERPRPLRDAARDGATPPTTVGTVLAALAIGVILYRTDAGIDPINLAAAVVAVVATGGTSLYTVLRVLRAAEPQVTPVDDPRNNAGEQLIPRGTALLGEILEQLLELRATPPAAAPPEVPEDPADSVEAYDWAEADPSPPRHARTQKMPAVDLDRRRGRVDPAGRPRRLTTVPPETMPPADPDWYADELTAADERNARGRVRPPPQEQRATVQRPSSPDATTAPTGLVTRTPTGQIPASALLAGSRARRRAERLDEPVDDRYGAGAVPWGGTHRA